MSYKEIMEFVRGQIKFDDNFPVDVREYVVIHFADCVEEYINEYIEQIPEDRKIREYILDLGFNRCIETYARDHEYEEEEEEPEYEEEEDEEDEW